MKSEIWQGSGVSAKAAPSPRFRRTVGITITMIRMHRHQGLMGVF